MGEPPPSGSGRGVLPLPMPLSARGASLSSAPRFFEHRHGLVRRQCAVLHILRRAGVFWWFFQDCSWCLQPAVTLIGCPHPRRCALPREGGTLRRLAPPLSHGRGG